VQETNVEKSIRGTQNPGTFRRRLQRVLLPSARGYSVIGTAPTDSPDSWLPRLLTPPTNFLPQTLVTHDNRILDIADRLIQMEDGRLKTLKLPDL